MTQALKKTRQEVEARLQQSSSSIASRLEAIESVLPGPSKRVRNLVSKKTLVKAGVVLAASVLAGIVVLRYRRDPKKEFSHELEHVSSSIGREVRKNLSKGLDADEAVSRALNKRPPILNIGQTESSFWSGMLSQLSGHVASALGPIIAEKIADRFKGNSDEK